MKYYLYIILTTSDTLYCGIARNPLERFKKHLEGKGAKYTRIHKPEKIVYLKEFEDKSLALKEEYRIKHKLNRAQKLEMIEKEKTNSQHSLEACQSLLE